jgi:hypothetical protein
MTQKEVLSPGPEVKILLQNFHVNGVEDIGGRSRQQ